MCVRCCVVCSSTDLHDLWCSCAYLSSCTAMPLVHHTLYTCICSSGWEWLHSCAVRVMVLLTVCSWQLAVRLGCQYFHVHLRSVQTCSSGDAEARTADCLPAATINANKMQQSPDFACSGSWGMCSSLWTNCRRLCFQLCSHSNSSL